MPILKPSDYVFLSGPMTGLPEYNYPAFFAAAEAIEMRYKCRVINPAFLPELMGEGRDRKHYVTVCLALVKTCTAMVQLPDWQKNWGSCQEHAEAELQMIPIYPVAEVLK